VCWQKSKLWKHCSNCKKQSIGNDKKVTIKFSLIWGIMKKFKPRHILNKYVGKVVLEKIFSHIIKFQINVAIYFCDFT